MSGSTYLDDEEDLFSPETDTEADAPTVAPLAPPRSPIGAPAPAPPPPSGKGRYVDTYRARRASRAPPTDFGEILPDAPMISAPSPKGPEQGLLKDMGDAFWHGALSMGADLAGAAKFVGDQANIEPLAKVGEASRAWAEDHMQRTVEGMSKASQDAMHASLFAGLSDDPNAITPGQAGYGRYAAITAMSALPSLVFALVPGGVIGRAATSVAKAGALAASREAGVVLSGAAAKAAGKEALAAGAGKGLIEAANVGSQAAGWGAAGGGRAYNALVKEIGDASEQEMGQNPGYQALRDAGKTDLQAKAEIIKKLAVPMAAAGAGVGAVTGAGGGQLLRAGSGAAIGSTLARRAALGGVEGAGLGAVQGAGDTAIEQYGANQGTGKAYDPGAIVRAGAGGALGGGLLGAGAGAIHGRAKPEANPDVDPAVAAAMGSTPGPPAKSQIYGPPEFIGPPEAPYGPPQAPPQPQGPPEFVGPPEAPPSPVAPAPSPAGPPPSPAAAASPLATDTATPPGSMPTTPPTAEMQAAAQPAPAAAMPVADPAAAPPAATAPPVAATPAVAVPHPTTPATALPKVEALKAQSKAAEPAKPRSSTQIQREEGVGHVEAQRRADAEKAAAEPAVTEDVPETAGGAAATSTLGYDRNPDDALAGRVEHINERLADPNLPAGTRKELQSRVEDFGQFISTRDAVAHSDPSLQADIKRMRVGDTVTGVNADGETVTGRMEGFGPSEVGITDAEGLRHDLHPGSITKVERVGGQTKAAALKAKSKGEAAPDASATVADEKTTQRIAKLQERLADPALPKGTRLALEKRLKALTATRGAEVTPAPQGVDAAGPEPASVVDTGAGDTLSGRQTATVQSSLPSESPQAPAEAPPAPQPAAEPVSHAAVRAAVEDAADAVVEPLSKSNKAAVLKRMMAEVDDLMQLHKTPAALAKALKSWAEDHKDPIAGTKTWRSEVYDEVKDRLSGASEKPKGDYAEQARQSAMTEASEGSAPKRGGPAEGVAEDVETVKAGEGADLELDTHEGDAEAQAAEGHGEGGESSEGLVTNYEGGRKELQGDSLERHGKALLKQVLNDEIDPHAAAEKFGDHSKTSNASSRNFAHFVEQEIARVTHEDFAKEAVDLYKNAYDKNYVKPGTDHKLTAKERQGMTRRADNLLKQSDPERIQQLQDLHEDLLDPVGAAARRETERGERESYDRKARRSEPSAHAMGISPAASRFISAVHASPINDLLRLRVEHHNDQGTPYTTHAALRDIINHATGDMLRPMRELATRMLKLAPDIEIHTPETSLFEGNLTRRQYQDRWRDGGIYGQFTRRGGDDPGAITLNSYAPGEHATTLMHEIMHATTARYLQHLEQVSPNHRDIQTLKLIQGEMGRMLGAHDALSRMDPKALDELTNAASNIHETHAALMTSPELHALANRMPVSDEFRAAMAKQGYPLAKQSSLWKAFTGFIRKILGRQGPISASESTFFDHVMGPLQNIAERGAQFNEQRAATVAAENPHLAPGIALARSLGERFQGGRNAVRRSEYLDSAREHGMKLINGLTPDDILHDRYKGMFNSAEGNPLTKLQAAKEAGEHASRQFFDEHEPTVTKWNSDWKATPAADREALGQLMNDTTIANVGLNGRNNDHLKTPEQKAQIAQLQARFNALPKTSQDLYERAVKFYSAVDKQVRGANLRGILDSAFPDATPGQRQAFSDTVHSAKTAEAFLDKPENSALAAALGGETEKGKIKLARAVVKLLSVGRVRGDYFPLKRDGDWVVRYGEGEDYGSERYKTRTEAQERTDQLHREGMTNIHQVDISDPVRLRQAVGDHPALHELTSAIRENGLSDHADQIEEMAQRIVLRNATQTELSRAKRRGIKGAMTDHGQVMAKDVLESRRQVGVGEYGGARWRALNEMKTARDRMATTGEGDVVAASRLIQEHEKRMAVASDPSGIDSQLARRATAFGFVQSLMSMSHTVVNTMQAEAMATALLGGRHGLGSSTVAFNKALLQGAPRLIKSGARNTFRAMRGQLQASDWHLANVVRDRYIDAGAKAAHMHPLFKALDDANLIDYSEAAQLRDTAKGGATRVGRAWNNFTSVFAAGNHAMDVANKSATAKAAFDLEFRKTGDVAKSTAYAVDMVRKVMPNYNPYNRARLTSGKLAPVMQFKNYGLHMYGTMGNLVREVYKNEAGGRAEAAKTLALIFGTHSLLAGGLTTLGDPIRYGLGAYDFFSGHKQPQDWNAYFQNQLTDLLGQTGGEVAARGLPTLLGMSLYRRTGLSDMLSVPELESFDKKGALGMISQAALGASGENGATLFDGVEHLIQAAQRGSTHELSKAVETMMPRPLRDAWKGANQGLSGLKDTSGKPTLSADKISGYDTALQMFGIQPQSVARFQAGRHAIQTAMADVKDQRGKLARDWVQAEPGDRPDVMQGIVAFNRANPGARITMSQLLQQLRASQKDVATPGSFGLRLPAKQARELKQEGRFANF